MRLPAPNVLARTGFVCMGLACMGLACMGFALMGLALMASAAGPAEAQGRPRAPDGVPPNPFASNYPSRPPEAARPRRARPAGEALRPPRDIPMR